MLVVCKSFSQIGIQSKDSIVILKKNIAEKVIKDLIKGDTYKSITIVQEERLKNFQEEINQYKNIGKVNDSIINTQLDYIQIQNKLLNKVNKLHIHGYIAIQTIKLTLVNPIAYGQIMLEYKRWNLGPIYYIQKTFKPDWGIIFQYQIF